MNHSTIHSTNIKTVCDGYECDEKASVKIKVNAGKFGKISLSLCKECAYKFNGEKNEKK